MMGKKDKSQAPKPLAEPEVPPTDPEPEVPPTDPEPEVPPAPEAGMVTITYLGRKGGNKRDRYQGRDAGKSITILPGKSATVSEAKAEQLQRDFPGLFDGG